MLILFSGVPCSGKSTLAMLTAEHLKTPCFVRDNLQEFLFKQGLVETNTVDGYHLLLKLAKEQLKLDVSVVLDGVFGKQGFRDEARQIAEQYNLEFKPIHCHISNQTVWKNRWHHRQSIHTVSHWMNPTWDDVLRIENNFQVWETADILSLDAINPVEQNFQLIKDYLNKNHTKTTL
ncbi:MAG: AAA family ATPase [Phototrophicaceae bacterium]